METTHREPALGSIRLLFGPGTVAGMSDGQLLDRFLDRRADEEAAEVAFAALVERHGPMVLRACRARLGDEHDAQDAFQATFLILARKAGSIREQDSAASWLQGVARRVASGARKASSVRRARERSAAVGKMTFVADADRSEVVPLIRETVGELPEKYRAPLLLCLLDGLTHEEAATRLGWPVGTVKTRVRRAKDRLRVALTRRGLAPSVGAIGAALMVPEASAMPASLVQATARAAMGSQMGRDAALVSASVAGLVKLGLGSLTMTRLKMTALGLTTIGVLALGATSGLARQGPVAQEKIKPAEPRPVENQANVLGTIVVAREGPDEAEEARLDAIEAAQLDVELLQEEVFQLKNNVTTASKVCLDAKAQIRGFSAPPGMYINSFGGVGGGGVLPLTGEKLEAAKRQAQEYLDYQVKSLEEARAAYLAKNHELKQEQRRLKGLMHPPGPQRYVRAEPSPPTTAPADLERRLTDVERKLDLILKALDQPGREPAKEKE